MKGTICDLCDRLIESGTIRIRAGKLHAGFRFWFWERIHICGYCLVRIQQAAVALRDAAESFLKTDPPECPSPQTDVEDPVMEDYIRSLVWSADTPDAVRTLVAGNIRGFARYMRERK